jgi:uncharacterized delta-60 repeat protein
LLFRKTPAALRRDAATTIEKFLAVFGKPTLLILTIGAFLSTNRDLLVQHVLDDFNPNVEGLFGVAVRAVVAQPDGKVLVGGGFANIGGASRSRIARLDPLSGFADSFNPSADSFGSVYSIVQQTDGKILVGGTFTNIGGQFRNRIARLDPTTGLADSFNPNADNDVLTLAVQADNKIIVGGFFDNIGGQSREMIARIDAATGQADSFNPGANATVFSLAVQPDGKILVGGGFTAIGGQPRGHLARFDSSTGELDAFDPNIDQSVNSVALQPDGKILAGGNFTRASAQPRGRVARFATPQPRLSIQRANTNIVLSWSTNFTGYTLELNTNLNGNAWNTVSPVPVVSGTNNVVTNNISGTVRFYRLRQ